MVAQGTPCLGPVTQAGCGNLCPPHGRGCYGCFGPMETPNTSGLGAWFAAHETGRPAIRDMFRTYNAGATAFRKESEAHE
jgi:coenzyme F420-reducing hydrogenase gamma subunit